MVLNKCVTFYRYDLQNPPDNWDSNFRNFEYNFDCIGAKNKSNFLFFTDSKEIAVELGVIASKNNNMDSFYITSCKTVGSLNILDFSNSHNIYQMLCVLHNVGINVLIKDFMLYDNDFCSKQENTFELLKSDFENAEKEIDSIKKAKLVMNLKHPNSDFEDVGLLGQLLTDFENGICFRKLLKEKKIDGYRWREFKDNRGFSYCLLYSDCLTSPIKEERKASR